MPLKPKDRRANFSHEPVRLGLKVQPALMDSQVWQIEEKVFKSEVRHLLHTDRRQYSSADVCNTKMGSADQSYPGLALQEGQPECKLRKLKQRRTISVKGRRHILSVLKPVEERVKVEVEEPFKLERKVLLVKEPSSWSWGLPQELASCSWTRPSGQYNYRDEESKSSGGCQTPGEEVAGNAKKDAFVPL